MTESIKKWPFYVLFLSSLIGFTGLEAKTATAAQVEVAYAPANNLGLATRAILGAQKSLKINIYEFSSKEIEKAITNRIQNGVQVEILQEGQPVGGISKDARAVQSRLISEMKQGHSRNRYLLLTSKVAGNKRFRFDHAKYIVIDSKKLLIGSENFSPTGHPSPHTKGNRGWEVLVEDLATVQTFESVFDGDIQDSHTDLLDLLNSNSEQSLELLQDSFRTDSPETFSDGIPNDAQAFSAFETLNSQDSPITGTEEHTVLSATQIDSIFSPQSSLQGLTDLLRSADTSIDLQLLSISSHWGQESDTSPLITELISAAKRGVRLRVLLNDDAVFSRGNSSRSENLRVSEILTEAAKKHRLKLSVRIANLDAMGVTYIHNKGALLDGHKTLVSSINWNQNSVTNNREAAIVMDSSTIFRYYESLFENDWQVSGATQILRTMIDVFGQLLFFRR